MSGLDDELPALRQMVDDLAARLRAVEDERAIIRTFEDYAHAIDYGNDEAWLDCFTDDAVFDMRSRRADELNRTLSGHRQLREFIEGYGRAPEHRHQHLLLAPIITIDGQRAEARSYFLIVCEHEGEPVVRVFGRYRDELLRCEDGRWRLRRRVAESECWRDGVVQYVGARSAES